MGSSRKTTKEMDTGKTPDEDLRRLLEGQATIDDFSGHPLEKRARILHILNITFKAVGTDTIVHKAREILGEKGDILHIPAEDPTMPYLNAAMQKGRLLTPLEYGGMLNSFEGLRILFTNAVKDDDKSTVRKVIEKVKSLIPNKALVLARMNDYNYEKVLAEYMENAGAVDLADANQFMDYVASKVPELEVKDECALQLSRELLTLDNMLSIGEFQRTPETREWLVKKIVESSPKYYFVNNNNLRSKAYYDAYPEQFQFEDMCRHGVKWKCEGECMGCPNWKRSLAKKTHSYSKW
jgi:hypothetical protein